IELLRIAEERDFDLVLIPCPSEGIALESLVREIRSRSPRTAIVLMTDATRIHEALALLERRVDHYVLRPPQPLELRVRLERLLGRDEAAPSAAPPSREHAGE